MFKARKGLRRDSRGNVIAIAGASLPLIIGAAGLATDTIQWTNWKRELQRSADTAAMAGVYASAQGETVSTAVSTALTKTHNSKVALATGYPQVTYPTAASFTNGVQVVLATQRRLPFTSLFMSAPPTITATARAGMVADGDYCLVALDNSATSAITIGGSANANLGCGVISNSISATQAIGTNGNAYNLTASPVAGVGGLPSSIRGASNLKPYHVAMPDPYANKYSTDLPTGTTCKNNINASGARDGSNNVNPGCYKNFNPGNGTTRLNPGVYFLENTSLSMNGNTKITGTGVTLILMGTNPGTITANGNSELDISAPTDANCGVYAGVDTCNYKKMLMLQSPNATPANSNEIKGNNGTKLDGAIYFPKGSMKFTGSSSQATKCMMVVTYRVDFSGNSDIQNNTTGCTANTTVNGRTVRLIG